MSYTKTYGKYSLKADSLLTTQNDPRELMEFNIRPDHIVSIESETRFFHFKTGFLLLRSYDDSSDWLASYFTEKIFSNNTSSRTIVPNLIIGFHNPQRFRFNCDLRIFPYGELNLGVAYVF